MASLQSLSLSLCVRLVHSYTMHAAHTHHTQNSDIWIRLNIGILLARLLTIAIEHINNICNTNNTESIEQHTPLLFEPYIHTYIYIYIHIYVCMCCAGQTACLVWSPFRAASQLSTFHI